jgi:uncharacterized RmlC-like cupin family protein
MSPLQRRLIVASALATVLGAGLFFAYLPQIKRSYWDNLQPKSGPERHAGETVRIIPSATPYDRWLDEMRDRIPLREGLFVADVEAEPLSPWPAMGDGVNGLYLRFADYQVTDGRILELPSGGGTAAQRHLFEMGVYFLHGPGHTLFFRDGQAPLRLDWQAGSLVSVPMNVLHQHFNDSDRAVRLVAVTSFPLALNVSGNEAFVYGSDFDFADRFDGGADYFEVSEPLGDRRTERNFVAEAPLTPLAAGAGRGGDSLTMSWQMAGNTAIDMHVTEMPAMEYMKAHRHSSDAFILILDGEGYSLTWAGGAFDKRQRIDWRRHTLFVPPTYWYHQHFNSGRQKSRHLAINAPTIVRNLGLRFSDQIEESSPEVLAEWEAALRAPAGESR